MMGTVIRSLAFIAKNNHAVGGVGNDFFPQQASSTAFDHVQWWV